MQEPLVQVKVCKSMCVFCVCIRAQCGSESKSSFLQLCLFTYPFHMLSVSASSGDCELWVLLYWSRQIRTLANRERTEGERLSGQHLGFKPSSCSSTPWSLSCPIIPPITISWIVSVSMLANAPNSTALVLLESP